MLNSVMQNMIPTLTDAELRILRDSRLNAEHLQPFIIKWLNTPDRPDHIIDMLRRFAAMKVPEQSKFYVNPFNDELITIDLRRQTYLKKAKEGWVATLKANRR